MSNEQKNLVSISRDFEHGSETESKIYLRMYTDALHSGLLADMGPERWLTLCAIAAFMDKDGNCYPTQQLIADKLNISRETANRRIKRLLAYRWQGQPVIEAVRQRNTETQQWANTVYTVLPISMLAIF
jgi:hypothetical protein